MPQPRKEDGKEHYDDDDNAGYEDDDDDNSGYEDDDDDNRT